MSSESYNNLLSFLDRLEAKKIHYTLEHSREEAIMVIIAAPGERWEVEFMEDGSIEIERFISTGKIESEIILEDLFNKYSD